MGTRHSLGFDAKSEERSAHHLFVLFNPLYIHIQTHLFTSIKHMVFHGFWLVSMVFQGGFMVFGRFPWLMVPGWLNPS